MTSSARIRRHPRSGSDHHVQPVINEPVEEKGRYGSVIGAVTVDHHVDVGVDVSEHASDNGTLAGSGLGPHNGTCLEGPASS